MKLREIFRFEFAYQVRRVSTWLPFVALAAVAFLFVRKNFLADALYADFFINSPYVVAVVTVFCTLFWLLLGAGVAGEVAVRDVEAGMHPLTWTAPVSKAQYLGGRFLAAFALNGLVMLAVPVGVMLAVYLPGVDAEVVGPFRPAAYLTAYGYLALPNAFIVTAVQFAVATLGRRAIGSYVGSVLLFSVVYGGIVAVMVFLDDLELATALDALGHMTIFDVTTDWTPIEKGTRLLRLEGALLWRRLLWLGIACGVLALTYARFRFEHLAAKPWWSRIGRRRVAHAPTPGGGDVATRGIAVPQVRGTFGPRTHMAQALAIAWASFRAVAKSRGGLIVILPIAVVAVMILPEYVVNMGTPLLPRTTFVLTLLTAPVTQPMTPWLVIPMLTVIWAGELVWREREAGLGEITDAAPVPEWVPFLGKFLALGLLLAVWMLVLMAIGMLIQASMGYYRFETGLYLRVLFGLQLPQYLLFALLVLVVHGLVNQKYLGHMAAMIVFGFILFAARLGIGHNLLVYGSTPGWRYSDMRGFGPSLGPWAWFMAYWAAWALLLAVVARLLWVRGLERRLRVRLHLARGRLTRPTARTAALASALILGLGGFIFYNTNVLNEYRTAADAGKLRAEYERRYGRYRDVPQPRLAGVNLHVEIHPRRRAADIRGAYTLVNNTAGPIDTIHVAPAVGIRTGEITFDRPAARVLVDEQHWHRIYALRQPLRPGESLRLNFTVGVAPRGFRNGGVDAVLSVTEASTYFRSQDWLPAIGYQKGRELFKPGDRRAYGLPSRPMVPSLADAGDVTGESATAGPDRITLEVVVGTDANQTAVAPGALRRTWTERGRRYFHYATDAPIGGEYAFFSAAYAVHEERWTPPAGAGKPVTIQVYHHPAHSANLHRMLRSVRGSLAYYTRAYGPYPHGGILRLVENPGQGLGAHAEPGTIDYTEGFTRYNPEQDPQGWTCRSR